jgi:hypothetical protein
MAEMLILIKSHLKKLKLSPSVEPDEEETFDETDEDENNID